MSGIDQFRSVSQSGKRRMTEPGRREKSVRTEIEHGLAILGRRREGAGAPPDVTCARLKVEEGPPGEGKPPLSNEKISILVPYTCTLQY